ncbi:hypothetical protein CDAR_401581 [Caerostris darwini]|uniref:Uncharacterized protein n=1 Tax=Caerostris darwini TaxID=1538125 RepID=A0AAV4RR30_9ARAC|nr:hypothetical protein CDAR_401581 [Caerostris darwini]
MKSIILDISQNNILPDDTFPPAPHTVSWEGWMEHQQSTESIKSPPFPLVQSVQVSTDYTLRMFEEVVTTEFKCFLSDTRRVVLEEVSVCESWISLDLHWGNPAGTLISFSFGKRFRCACVCR